MKNKKTLTLILFLLGISCGSIMAQNPDNNNGNNGTVIIATDQADQSNTNTINNNSQPGNNNLLEPLPIGFHAWTGTKKDESNKVEPELEITVPKDNDKNIEPK